MQGVWLVAVLAGALGAEPAEEVVRRSPEWTFGVQARGVVGLTGGLSASGAAALGFEARVELGRLLVGAGAGWLGPAAWCGPPAACLGDPFVHASAAALLNPDDVAAVSLGAGLEARLLVGSGTVGLVPLVEVAVLLWRHGPTRLTVDLRAGQHVLPVAVPSDLVRWVTVYPTEVSLGVTVGW